MLSSEKGSSSWLTALPILEYGFCLHKDAFHDSLCLQYGLRPPCCLQAVCVWQIILSQVEHAFSCPCGGLPTICCNELWDITTQLLYHNIEVYPLLQGLSGESFQYRSANTRVTRCCCKWLLGMRTECIF